MHSSDAIETNTNEMSETETNSEAIEVRQNEWIKQRSSLRIIFVVASLLGGVGIAITLAIMGTIQSESLVLIFSQAENNLHLRY